jgi:hypothetical protein
MRPKLQSSTASGTTVHANAFVLSSKMLRATNSADFLGKTICFVSQNLYPPRAGCRNSLFREDLDGCSPIPDNARRPRGRQ